MPADLLLDTDVFTELQIIQKNTVLTSAFLFLFFCFAILEGSIPNMIFDMNEF